MTLQEIDRRWSLIHANKFRGREWTMMTWEERTVVQWRDAAGRLHVDMWTIEREELVEVVQMPERSARPKMRSCISRSTRSSGSGSGGRKASRMDPPYVSSLSSPRPRSYCAREPTRAICST
jgi:hypothetical protein